MTQGARFGPQFSSNGVTFRLWAPAAKRVEIMLDRACPMTALPDGWFAVNVPDAGAGTRYKYLIDGEIAVPDPASHFQPEDAAGPSEVVDHQQFEWENVRWHGRPWHEAVILELHVGTFTKEGTFRSAIDKLDRPVQTLRRRPSLEEQKAQKSQVSARRSG